MLYIGRESVEELAKMDELIEVMEGAFRELGEGKVDMPLRPSLRSSDPPGTVHVMPAMLHGSRALGLKVVAHYSGNPSKFGVPTINGTVLYLDFDTGRVVAVLDGTYLTAIRTAAVSGLATRLLSRKDSSKLGLIGCGTQAETHLEAMSVVRPIKSALVYSPTRAHREDFARRMSAKFGIDVKPVESSMDATKGADIVVTATPSPEPLLKGEWLKGGSHVNAVGSGTPVFREIDDAVLLRSKVVADDVEAAWSETGDFITPAKAGVFTKGMIHAGLCDVVTGKKAGRESEDEITLFKSVGLALEDVASAKFVYEGAVEANLGKRLD